MMRSSRRQAGFTLIETLIALAIVAAVAALVLPATVSQLRGARFDQATREVILAADACRSQAIKRCMTCKLVLTHRGESSVLVMEVVTPEPEANEAAPTLRAASISSAPGSADAAATAELLYTLPEGLKIQAASLAGSSSSASELSSASSERLVLGAFVSDGSAAAMAFELSGSEQRVRFTVLAGAGRLVAQRVEASDQLADAKTQDRPESTTEQKPATSSTSDTGANAESGGSR